MAFLFVAGGIALGVGLLAYFRPERTGLALLSLGIGSIFAMMWATPLALTYKEDLDAMFGVYSWPDLLRVVITVLPMFAVLLFAGKQRSFLPRALGAVTVALLVVVLLLPVLSLSVTFETESRGVYDFLARYREVIITATLLVGMIDTLFMRSPKPLKPGKD